VTDGASASLTYVGHSTVLLALGGVRLLTDPVLLARVGHVRRIVPVPRLGALHPLDAILISHAHADHLHLASLRRVAHGCTLIGPRGSGGLLARARPARVVELAAGDAYDLGSLRIEAVPAEHDDRRHPLGRRIPPLGFVLHGIPRIYFAGDTDLFEGMSALAGRVDVALLPVAGWGSRLPPGHLDPDSAARAVGRIRPAVAVPIHWGTLRSPTMSGAEPARVAADRFAAAVASIAPRTAVRILEPGEAMELDPVALSAGGRA
jgi:L-ascorbate metabolism protein UlaG (beta-lactamase superfamily)